MFNCPGLCALDFCCDHSGKRIGVECFKATESQLALGRKDSSPRERWLLTDLRQPQESAAYSRGPGSGPEIEPGDAD